MIDTKMERPYTTLFLLISVDGKISTGDTDIMDTDSDYPKIEGVKEGLKQYYDIEKQGDPFSLISGKVMVKIGANTNTYTKKEKTQCTLVVIDNKPHLNENGLKYLCDRFVRIIIVTTNKNHPVFEQKATLSNVEIIFCEGSMDFKDVFDKLKTDFGAERLTIQSGGELNAVFLREGLIDRVLVVVAPCLVGGKDTPSLVDGESLHTQDELSKIRSLELIQAKPLDNSYLSLEYKVNNNVIGNNIV